MSTHDSDQMTIVASTQPHNQLDNLHNDVVDGNVDEFDKEPNEPHDEKAYCRGKGNSLKLCREKQQTELNVRSVISTLSIRSEGCQKSAHISRDTDFAWLVQHTKHSVKKARAYKQGSAFVSNAWPISVLDGCLKAYLLSQALYTSLQVASSPWQTASGAQRRGELGPLSFDKYANHYHRVRVHFEDVPAVNTYGRKRLLGYCVIEYRQLPMCCNMYTHLICWRFEQTANKFICEKMAKS